MKWGQAFATRQRFPRPHARRWCKSASVGLAMISLTAAAPRAETRLELYPDNSGRAPERRVEAAVEGKPLALVCRRVWHADSSGQHFIEVASARFAAAGSVTVSLRGDSQRLGRPVLRTCGRDLIVGCLGNTLTFNLPGPGQYYLQLPGLAQSNGTFTVVFWVDDLRRLERLRTEWKSPGVVDVAGQAVRPDAELDQTAAIQRLLDRGGALRFSAGVYRSGSLRLRSATIVYFEPGAVLRALDAEEAVGAEFIAIEGARDVKLCGPGILDANSLAQRRVHNVHHLNITGSRNVTIEDLLIEESNSWAVHIRRSDNFVARNVKVFSGKDGFDPDASRDVLIEGAFAATADDSIAVKNRFPDEADGKTTERIVFTNSIVTTTKSALKVGTETRGLIRDVRFEDCDVFDGDRGIVLYARDGGPIEKVVWRNIRLFMTNWPQEKESGAVFHITIEKREAPTPVRDCLVENVLANWLFRSEFAGLPDAPLTGVALRNIRALVERPKSGKPALFSCRENVDLKLDGLKVDWQGHEAEWAGVVAGKGLRVPPPASAGKGRRLPRTGRNTDASP